MDSQYFSPEGLEKLKKELQERLMVLRPEIAARLKEAKDEGDLSENAGFDAAREAQQSNENRIEEIKEILDKAVVFTGHKHGGLVGMGSRVKVKSKDGEKEYSIVGASESDPIHGAISNESPLGQAFLGKKKGDEVRVRTPKGEVVYEIKDIN